jgi:hypothetical protein
MTDDVDADGGDSLELDRWASRRAEYIERTTKLSNREALALAYSERGVSDSGIAKRIDSTEGTVGNYLDRAVAAFGPSTRHPRHDPEVTRDIEPVGLEDLADWRQHRREVWREAADRHPDFAPDLDEQANREAFPELYDGEPGSAEGKA